MFFVPNTNDPKIKQIIIKYIGQVDYNSYDPKPYDPVIDSIDSYDIDDYIND